MWVMLYPEERHVTENQILGWASDMLANGEINAYVDVYEAVENINDNGKMTIVWRKGL